MSADDAGYVPAICIILRGDKIVSPRGWPSPSLPMSGERVRVADYYRRELLENPFFEAMNRRLRHEPLLRVPPFRPAEITLAWWQEEWPYLSVTGDYGAKPARPPYHRTRTAYRWLVAHVDQLRAGGAAIYGLRRDKQAEGPERVSADLFDNPYMRLDPNAVYGGQLRPEAWKGHLPTGLPEYHWLTLGPAPVDAGRALADAVASQSVPAGEDAPSAPVPASYLQANPPVQPRPVPAQSDGTPPTLNVGGRPGVAETCLARFQARRNEKLPLRPTISAEASEIRKAWPTKPKKPLAKTIAEHISAAYKASAAKITQ